MTEKRRRHILEVIPVMVIMLILAVYIISSATERGGNDLQTIESGWFLSGESVDVLPERQVCEPGKSTVISTVLDERFSERKAICFYSVYETVHVRLDDQTIYEWETDIMPGAMSAPPSRWNVVILPGNSAGKTLYIELASPYARYANILPEITCGTMDSIDWYVRMKTLPPFIIALSALVVGIGCSIIAVALRYYAIGSKGLYSFSLFIVALALFLASQQTTILSMLSRRVPYILVQCIALMMCPIMYTRYMLRSSQGVLRRIAMGLHGVAIANLALILLLHVVGVRDMPEMMSSTRNLCVLIAVYVFLIDMRSHRKVISALFACGIGYVVFSYYLTGKIPWITYLIMFVYFGMMLYNVIATIMRTKSKEIRLAAALEVSKSELATVQITSHFFYHTLDSIRALIRMDTDKAYKMTGDFAKYVRYRVDGVERLQETVQFSRELRAIRAYTDIKQAQLGDRFCMEFDIETEDFEILPLTVQPLVENAVIHAVQKRKDGGIVRLVCTETAKGYHIEVIDNGPGTTAVSVGEAPEQRSSTAIKNVNTRLEFYGIAPIRMVSNELGGMTVSMDTPKHIVPKEKKYENDIG